MASEWLDYQVFNLWVRVWYADGSALELFCGYEEVDTEFRP